MSLIIHLFLLIVLTGVLMGVLSGLCFAIKQISLSDWLICLGILVLYIIHS